ncbi:MAG: DNA-binding response regulator, partial [Alphaproteobacteria bacterium CG_4_9_14_3_um_filter_47_13]
LYPADYRLESDNKASTALTEKECALLLRLHEQRGDVVDRSTLLNDIWGYKDGIETHTLETHIYRLRQKIEKDPAQPTLLITCDQGYCLL